MSELYPEDELKGDEKAVCVLSGGLDSTTLLYELVQGKRKIHALSFDYGQKHKKELLCARKTCKKLGVPHKIIDLSVLGEIAPSALTKKGWDVPEGHYEDSNMSQTVVPNRNMVMLSLATAFAISIKAKKIFYGAHAGDHAIYADCTPEFVEAMKGAIRTADYAEIELEAPYTFIDKGDIVYRGTKIGVDYTNTWTCYKGGEKACGECGACVERLEAFGYVGLIDPIDYEE